MRFADSPFPTGTSPPAPSWATGLAAVDAALGGGFAYASVHEVYAAAPDDGAAAAGFVAALAIGMTQSTRSLARPITWLRTDRAARASGVIQGAGWADLGGAPGDCLLVLSEDAKALLRAGVDAVRSSGSGACSGGASGAVILESWGRTPELDLTASRRLSLAAEKSGVTLFILRIDADPVPSSAATRWSVASAPSAMLAAKAPGVPTFDIELLRQRSGPSGMRWRLEWDRDRRIFRDAALSGFVVPVPASRPAAQTRTEPLRPIARNAA